MLSDESFFVETPFPTAHHQTAHYVVPPHDALLMPYVSTVITKWVGITVGRMNEARVLSDESFFVETPFPTAHYQTAHYVVPPHDALLMPYGFYGNH